jgi:FAD/FMN-containing dehydrogenase
VRDRSPGFAATTAEFGADPGHLHHDTVVAFVIIQGASRNLDHSTMSPHRPVVSPRRRGAASRATRRSFLKLGVGGAALSLCPMGAASAQPVGATAWLDGDYLVDEASRSTVATDYGGAIRRMPRAIVRARTAEDIARVVAYANGGRIKVAMRGQGHSLSGQTLIDDGIVIDSGALNAVDAPAGDTVEAQAGATWGDVARAALAYGRLPPVMPDAMMLSVGGTLSVGGSGEAGFRFGAQVDHVRALDVVTGAGEVMSCSASHEPELFHMMLAGLGQCGIIVRARLGLAPAGTFVVTHTLTYSDLDAFLADQARLADSGAIDVLNGRLNRTVQGAWSHVLFAGQFVAAADEASEAPTWIDGLRHTSVAAPVVTPIWSYLDRRTASITSGKAKAKPNPSLVLSLPAEATKGFISEILASPKLAAGIWFFEVSPKISARHGQPLQKMPASALAYELRMQRRASAPDAADHRAMLAANADLVATAMQHGGKVYPPFAPILSAAQWRDHYGPTTWTRFAVAKRRFDPNNVLNPGAGIF